ncbi:spore germination protein (amino acid permease) [Alteribacillus persepolensis]|uniref:Spore germination protein (Amino acid permease) n=1 Tax=Alteribacillus persepolensis TaxID=568899 RepID=A0A1G7ZK44_9BACI|nr:spore germination protein [Alteribacillus persepolensis]SDH09093.1 spore germination protein (amino acid permease) [Alteribacillus persepolensis]
MHVKVKEKFQVSPPMVFFIIHAMQVGVGMLGFQRIIAKSSGYDSWIPVIIAGVVISLVIRMMYYILKVNHNDVIEVHRNLFGKWLGGLLSLALILYFYMTGVLVLRTYIEVIQVWVFEDLPTWVLTVLAAGFVYYVIKGGFRTVVGLCVAGVFIPSILFFILLMPLEYADFLNFLPIWKHSLKDILAGAKDTTLTFIGFELLLLFYPFIKHGYRSHKWAQLGHWASVVVYTLLMIVTLAFFSEGQLKITIWPTLTLLKIIEFPFIERFEYLGISLWLIIVVPNIVTAFWGASRGLKRLFSIKQRYVVLFMVLTLIIVVPPIDNRQAVNTLNEWVNQIGFWVIIAYIPFLCAVQFIHSKWKRKNET